MFLEYIVWSVLAIIKSKDRVYGKWKHKVPTASLKVIYELSLIPSIIVFAIYVVLYVQQAHSGFDDRVDISLSYAQCWIVGGLLIG